MLSPLTMHDADAFRRWRCRGVRSLFLAKCGARVEFASLCTGQVIGTLQSPSALKRMSVEELLKQEVVSVSRRPGPWGETASNVFVVSGQGASMAGVRTLPELLRLAPNLFVAQSHASQWAINTRGFVRTNSYSGKLLVMGDGRTVYSPFFSNVLQHRFMTGADHELLWDLNYRLMRDDIADTIGFSILPADLTFGQGSVFAQHEMRLIENRVRVTSGPRVENNYFSGWEWMPSVRVAWHPAKTQTFWTAASRAARIPSRIDTGFFIPADPPYVVAGGPDFGAEIIDAYEIGWRTRPARTFSITATAYFHDYDDLRSTELTSPVVIGNGVEGQSYGVELFADWEVTPVWRMRVGGFRNEQKTWLEPGSLDSERAQGEVSYPDFQVQLRNVFQLRPDLTLWTSLRRVGAVPAFENGISDEVPAYSELDASLVWSIAGQWELSLTGRNLFHGSHPEIGSDATRREIERSFSARFQWRY